ncbi:MAG: hypothetical protein ACI8QC_003986 [Planctomycetota bacterium]|jgi:hypothetical protein
MRKLQLCCLTLAVGAFLANTASAQLSGVVTEDGLISTSTSAIGTNDPNGGLLDVMKPNAGSTVRSAYLAAATHGPTIAAGDINLAGSPVTFTNHATNSFFENYFTDVTGIVQPIIDGAGAGLTQLAVTEGPNNNSIDGTILIVIFDDPAVTTSAGVIILFGGQNTTGDQFTISLAAPLDLTDPNATATMGLGISFGFQGTSGTSMISEIDVNGARLTSSAGGEDDGGPFNGGLITMGGLGDSTMNPANPFGGSTGFDTDDELYTLLPFVMTGDTQIIVDTINPTNDDNIFVGLFETSVPISIADETLFLDPLNAELALGCPHTITGTVTDAATQLPIAGRSVNFSVTSGPNTGATGTDVTDANGEATFTYNGTGGVGQDTVVADMLDTSGAMVNSNSAFADWLDLLAVSYCEGTACPCGNDNTANGGCLNSTGQGALLTASGSGSISADDLVLSCTNLPTNRFGLMYMGPETANLPFGDGIRCVGQGVPFSLFRYSTSLIGANGTLVLGPGIVGISQNFSAAGQIQLCQTWNFQCVFRDDHAAQCNTGWNTSNAIGVTFGL